MAPPFNWPAKVGTSSTVIKNATEWQDKGILYPHETIRWWNKNMKEIIDVFDPIGDPNTKWKTAVFFDWYDNYYKVCIHHHHDSEEKIYNPGIEAKGVAVGGNIKNDHEVLIAALEKVSTYRAKISSGDAQACKEFKQFTLRMIDDMEKHLAEEEVMYPQKLRDSKMTQEEEGKLVDTIIQSMGLDGNKKFLPSLVWTVSLWDGEENAMAFVGITPPPIQLMFHKCWVHDFNENVLKVFDALKQSGEFTPKTPECGCTVM